MLAEALQEEAKVHISPSTMVVRILELESSLESDKKRNQETYDVVVEVDRHTKEVSKTLQQEKESRPEDQKTHDDEVAVVTPLNPKHKFIKHTK